MKGVGGDALPCAERSCSFRRDAFHVGGVAGGVKVLELSARAVLCSLLATRAWTTDKYTQPIVLAGVLLFAPAPDLSLLACIYTFYMYIRM